MGQCEEDAGQGQGHQSEVGGDGQTIVTAGTGTRERIGWDHMTCIIILWCVCIYILVTLAALVGLLNNLLEKRSYGREKVSTTEIVDVMNKIKSVSTVLYFPSYFGATS